MNTQQTILTAINRATTARLLLQGRPSEAQARRARSMLAEARKELTTAMSGASVAVSEAKERDAFERSERRITQDSWLRLASEIVS